MTSQEPGLCVTNAPPQSIFFKKEEEPVLEAKQGNRKQRRAQQALNRSKAKLVAKIKKQIASLKKLEQ